MDQGKDPNVPSPDAVVFSSDSGSRMPEKRTPSPLAIRPEPEDEQTKQRRLIAMLFDNLSTLFHDQARVLVAQNLPWYPVQANPATRVVPGVLVAVGRPKGVRDS